MSSLSKSGELRDTIPMIICQTHMVHISLPYDTYSPPYDTYKRVYYLMSGSKQQIAARPATEKNVETHIYRSVCVSGFSVKRMTAIRNRYEGICHEDMAM